MKGFYSYRFRVSSKKRGKKIYWYLQLVTRVSHFRNSTSEVIGVKSFPSFYSQADITAQLFSSLSRIARAKDIRDE